jgi:tRNA A-37 threonylcarbamoyl transferase component Bud32
MQSIPHEALQVGDYQGKISTAYRDGTVLDQLGRLREIIVSPAAIPLTTGRNRNLRLTLARDKGSVDVVVKSFGRQGWLKERLARRTESKAVRTWDAAVHLAANGVGTPEPVAYLERREDGRLVESYYVAVYQQDISSFSDEFAAQFDGVCDCGRLMALLEATAGAVRGMHDAGFLHNDLGNQNILLRREGDEAWGDIQFIDLNRGRRHPTLTDRQRARDISRIYLPSDLLRVFKQMYHGDVRPTEGFEKWEKRYRRWFALHTASRPFRHPLRYLRERDAPAIHCYPPEKDMWVWDRRSVQPINVMKSRSRLRHYPVTRHLKIAWAAVASLVPVYWAYKALLRTCFTSRVAMKDRVGMIIEPGEGDAEREVALLKGLGRVPVLLRFYHHESEKEWERTAALVRSLSEDGHAVSIALVQDRRAALEPESWRSFVAWVLDAVGSFVDWVEVTHAVNRVKWGLWGYREHRALLDAVAGEAAHLPKLKLAGPAIIDFEPPDTMAALRNTPSWLRFGALSSHLYVDRRGAPENRQGRFSTVEKVAMARAMARASAVCDDRVLVTEVNWPLTGTGVYSPVTSPYETPGPRENDPNVTEDEYADYMIRYLVMTLCSGMVERVYWWRLVARGFGLVDDTDTANWRERPAYGMLKQFLLLLGEAEFVSKRGDEDLQVYSFEASGKEIRLVYAISGSAEYAPDTECTVLDAFGETVSTSGSTITVTGRPVYVIG